MRITIRVALALLLVVAVAGCQKVVYRDKLIEPPPEPDPPTPAEQLRGTWTSADEGYWDMQGELVGFTRRTLTFTGERWIWVLSQVLDDGTVADDHVRFGGWSATADEITRTEILWDGISHVEQSFVKDYVIDGDHLLVRKWDTDDESPDFRRYTRTGGVLLPVTFAGTIWHRLPVNDEDPHGMHLILREDGTFEWRYINLDPDVDDEHVLEGTWSHDAENLYLLMTVEREVDRGVPVVPTLYENRRFGYAPDGRLNHLKISGWWNEPDDPRSIELWNRYGRYFDTFVLAESPLE